MGLDDVLAGWQRQPGSFLERRVMPARAGRAVALPVVAPALAQALDARGVKSLWSHQAEAIAALAERDIVVATPTASGKSLCYHLPVFEALLADPHARALYLFPTTALARDQVESARALAAATGAPDLGVAVYDGDTPADQRRAARTRARIVATNPDMLHTGILPHHAQWAAFFAGLRYVVVDELHVYRGWFGSNVANLMRRLRRIAACHGATPRFVATSATIANPGELATGVLASATPVHAITESGAPEVEREFWLYNPPIVDAALGLRASYLKATRRITRELAVAGVPTLVFTRTRRAVEVLVRTLHDHADDELPASEVRGYRGGYLPDLRREVERALSTGAARVVVATSALELGIDVGGLGAVVIAGWPGSRAAVWQRAGRAGRRGERAAVVLVACSEPMDQYVAGEPEWLFGQPAEHGRIDADNLSVLVPHVKCAAFELPFARGERFGGLGVDETLEVLRALAHAGALHESADAGPGDADADAAQFHWVGDAYPAQEVSLRGPLDENFVVVNTEGDGDEVIAEVDRGDAAQALHPSAIYQVEGRTFQVDRLDWEARKAFVRPVACDHYTLAMTNTKVRVLEELERAGASALGEIHVRSKVVGFKKIRFHTHENVGYGEVSQPDEEMHTRALILEARGASAGAATADGTRGAAYALHHVGALMVMCDVHDLGRVVGDESCPWPTVFLHDAMPGGMGYANRLFDLRAELVGRARKLIEHCGCKFGCPACVGPVGELGLAGKQAAVVILGAMADRLHGLRLLPGGKDEREHEHEHEDRP